jgi:hypothetical protein
VQEFRARATSPKGGEGHFIQGNYKGHLSTFGEAIYLLKPDGTTAAVTNYPANTTAVQRQLRVTEIMYHPSDPPVTVPYDDQDFEFIELMNIGGSMLDLNGVSFSDGIAFEFAHSVALAPNQCIVLVRNMDAFVTRYSTNSMLCVSPYEGGLANGGERIKLEDPRSETILSFSYDDDWYPLTDGNGYSLEIINPFGTRESWDLESAWKPSDNFFGSPGEAVPEGGGIAAVCALAFAARRRKVRG